jgi:hypothetical protein
MNYMYQALLYVHNIGRWILLILLLVALFKSLAGMAGNKPYTNGDKKVGLFLMIVAHTMLLIGLYQWIAGPWGLHNIQNLGMGAVMKDKVSRFWAVEHFAGMLIGIILITIGRGVGKKNLPNRTKHSRAFWLFLIALIVIFASVPWPFRDVARPLLPGVYGVGR